MWLRRRVGGGRLWFWLCLWWARVRWRVGGRWLWLWLLLRWSRVRWWVCGRWLRLWLLWRFDRRVCGWRRWLRRLRRLRWLSWRQRSDAAFVIASILVVAVRPASGDSELVRSRSVTNIGSERSVPSTSVHGADLSLRNTVLVKHVGVHEAASGSAVEILGIVLGLSLTSSGAAFWAESLSIVPCLLGDVGVASLIRWCIDGAVVAVCSSVSWDGVARWAGLWSRCRSRSWSRSWSRISRRLSWSRVGWRLVVARRRWQR